MKKVQSDKKGGAESLLKESGSFDEGFLKFVLVYVDMFYEER